MRDIKEILRQKWVLGRSHREVAASIEISAGAVAETLQRARAAGLTDWPTVEQMAPSALEECLYPPVSKTERPQPDCRWIHRERRRVGVTLELLHMEYAEKTPGAYRYTQFCEIYTRWLGKRNMTMRQVHRAGEKTFVDYSGKRPRIWDGATGESKEVELFVAVLGASNYTFAEATLTQRSPDWIASHTRAVEYFGGVTEAFVCDQLRSGVTKPCWYEPEIQRVYEDWARHQGTLVLPARARHPRDKAKVEVAVLITQRWILARLRNEKHFSLDSLNQRIRELLEELNDRVMRIYDLSRRQMYEMLDQPALLPLPGTRFVYADWKHAKVSIDYHIELDGHFYSVPYRHVGEEVELRFSSTTVEVIADGARIASHARSFARGQHSTVPEHMPAAHREHMQWSPTRMINWAETIGPQTRTLVAVILESRPHPEMGYRSCLGILRLGKSYGQSRLEAACARALTAGARSYRHVDSILKSGLDRVPINVAIEQPRPPGSDTHENIRGPKYYN